MPTVTIRGEDGNIIEREVVDRGMAIVRDNTDPGSIDGLQDIDESESAIIEPAVTQRIEYDHEGKMSQITTVCGESENRREGDNKADITVEGVCTTEHLDDLKTLEEGQHLTLVSDLEQGEVIVRRITLEQNTDIIHFTPDGGEPKLAFGFQLQLKKP